MAGIHFTETETSQLTRIFEVSNSRTIGMTEVIISKIAASETYSGYFQSGKLNNASIHS